MSDAPFVPEEELTTAPPDEIEARYRAQVIERYNRLGFAGLGVNTTPLSEVALDNVFVRLTLTVEKNVREPIPAEEEAMERRNPRRRGERSADPPRERIVVTQEPISLSDALTKHLLTKHLLIVGEPGAGKSTLLRWLAVTFAGGKQREADRLGPQADADRLPLLVELGRLPEVYLKAESRETPNWRRFLPDYLTQTPPFDEIPASLIAQALDGGRCLLLCDGLDEIADLSARQRMAESLAEYALISANRLVISSRPAGVSGSEAKLGDLFQRLTIQRFTPEEVQRFFHFVYKHNPELSPEEQMREANALYDAVCVAPKTLELAATPLLATLLLLIWNEEGYLPERRVDLYERCCKHLIKHWGMNHKVGSHELLSKMRDESWERHLHVLAPVAYYIHSQEQRTDAGFQELTPILAQALLDEGLLTEDASALVDAEDYLRVLGVSSGLLQRMREDRYGFPHLTFQEYLAARYIAAQPDPDYIDLVMVHLHKAWWREVHLLVIGHLGSKSEMADRASNLLYYILTVYPPPWKFLCPERFDDFGFVWFWKPLLNFKRLANYIDRPRFTVLFLAIPFLAVLSVVIFVVIVIIAIPRDLRAFVFLPIYLYQILLLTRHFIVRRIQWQWQRRIAWKTTRQFIFTATGFINFMPVRTSLELRQTLAKGAQSLLLEIIWDHDNWSNENTALLQLAVQSLESLKYFSDKLTKDLLQASIDADGTVRGRAFESLRMLGQLRGEIVPILVSMLDDSSWMIKLCAADWLVRLECASEDTISVLVSALNHSDSQIRKFAVQVLGNIKQAPSEVCTALVSALADSDSDVRSAAAESLGDLGQLSRNSINPLILALKDPEWKVKRMVANALIRIDQVLDDDLVIASLTSALADSTPDVRRLAAQALGELRKSSEISVTALTATLNDPDKMVRTVAARALVKLGQRSEQLEVALTNALHDTYWTFWREGRLDLIMSEGGMQWTAAKGLGELAQVSDDAMTVLVSALSDLDDDVRAEAAESLGKLGNASEEVINALVSALDDSHWRKRFVLTIHDQHWREQSAHLDGLNWAARLFWVLIGQYWVRKLLMVPLLYLQSAPDVRGSAAQSLGELGQGSERVVKALITSLDDPSSYVRVMASNSLVKLGEASEIVQQYLLSALRHPKVRVRQAAASSLVKSGYHSGNVIETLTSALNNSDDSIREWAAGSLGLVKVKDEDKLRTILIALNRRLHDGDASVRRTALASIRHLLDGRPIPGYRWVPIRERRERFRRRQIAGYWVIAITVVLLLAWVAAGVATYLRVDPFIERFVAFALALAALAAGGVQILSYFRRPPWDR